MLKIITKEMSERPNLWEALVEILEAQIWDGATVVNIMPSFHLGFHISKQ